MKLRNGSVWHDRKRTFCGLPWSFTKYELTEDRFFRTMGFFKVTYDEVRLFRITDTQLTINLIQRIFGIGSIEVKSSDDHLGNFVIKNVKNPMEVNELISNLSFKERKANNVFAREIIGDDCDHDDDYN